MNEELEVIPASAIEQMSRAEVDIQIATAKKYPRVLSKVKINMLSFATIDVETAASCFYTLPRGGKSIQGPSVRLAEIAVSCYGNMRAGSRIISVVSTGDNPHVVIQAVAHDLENNTSVQMEKRRRINTKKGRDGERMPISEDDITLAANACSAVALRDAIFKVVPMVLIKPVFDQARKTAIGKAETLNDRRGKAIAAFAKMGVVESRVLAMLEKAKVEDIDLEDLGTLLGVFNSIKDGDATIEELFPEPKVEMSKPAEEFVNGDATKAPAPKAEKLSAITQLRNILTTHNIPEGDFMDWATTSNTLDGDATELDQIKEANAARLIRGQALWVKHLTRNGATV